jgi:hypothetical protein
VASLTVKFGWFVKVGVQSLALTVALVLWTVITEGPDWVPTGTAGSAPEVGEKIMLGDPPLTEDPPHFKAQLLAFG